MRRRELIAGIGGLALAPVLGRMHGSTDAGAAQEASPEAASGGDSLADMLAMAPDVLAGSSPTLQIAQYANPALQQATLGIAPPSSTDDAYAVTLWVRSNWWMALPDPLRTQTLSEDWRPTFGFDAFQVDQSLAVGEPPDTMATYRGRFDEDELRAAWSASGYTPVDIEGVEAYSLSEDGSFDLSSTVGQLALAQMNNAAILPNGTLLFAPTLDGLRTMVATTQGQSATLADQPDVASLVSSLDPTVISAYLVPGDALRANPADVLGQRASPEQIAAVEEVLAEAEAGLEPMPRPRLAAVGVTAGGPLPVLDDEPPATPAPGTPLAHDVVALVMDDRVAAETAISTIEARLENGKSLASDRPYSDYFADWDLSVAADAPVVMVNLTPSTDATPDIIFQMLLRRDLLFVGWRDDEATPAAGRESWRMNATS